MPVLPRLPNEAASMAMNDPGVRQQPCGRVLGGISTGQDIVVNMAIAHVVHRPAPAFD